MKTQPQSTAAYFAINSTKICIPLGFDSSGVITLELAQLYLLLKLPFTAPRTCQQPKEVCKGPRPLPNASAVRKCQVVWYRAPTFLLITPLLWKSPLQLLPRGYLTAKKALLAWKQWHCFMKAKCLMHKQSNGAY